MSTAKTRWYVFGVSLACGVASILFIGTRMRPYYSTPDPGDFPTSREDVNRSLQKSLQQGDQSFIALGGVAATVPGSDGEFHYLVDLKGIRVLPGTECVASAPRLPYEDAIKIATAYNQQLLKHLRANLQRDPQYLKLIQDSDRAIAKLEHRNLHHEVKRMRTAKQLHLIGIWCQIPGLSDSVSCDPPLPVISVNVNSEVLTQSQKIRFDKALKEFVIPFNRAVLAELNRRKTHKKAADQR